MSNNYEGIQIPDNLNDILPDGSFVFTLIKNIKNIIKSGMHYFPEYTLHDESHINKVLEFVDELIPIQTVKILDYTSVEILLSATLIHDLGMFIKMVGLKRLIFGEHKNNKVKYLDKETWNEAWVNFYHKARRYDNRKLLSIFGNTDPIEKLPNDDIPESDTKRQRLLYGEFLRQNHHRLAYNIAHGIFPANGQDEDVFRNCNCDEFTKDMIGLVARSHRMKFRDCEEYLQNHKIAAERPNEPQGVPIYYLMSVLDIADTLHAGKQRAPKEITRTSELDSPKSKNEFEWNQAVYDKMTFDSEKKSVYIEAIPENSLVYLALEEWLISAQQKLDSCWATLSEKYRNKYELSIHRINTNIFNEKAIKSFNEQFLTRKAMLTANPDIVKLLVSPLYGDNPSFGVRELLQNSVDGCNERIEIEIKKKNRKYKGSVIIDIDTEKGIFTITDNGVGMNEDILLNYYLVAGSSFRDSSAWRDSYVDDNKKTTVLRSGRFGVGALATFLIGDTVKITTRHVDDGLGYCFIYNVNDLKPINVERVNDIEVGTTISILMSPDSLKFFKDDYNYHYGADLWYDWYHLKTPDILITLDKSNIQGGKPLEASFHAPTVKRDADGWFYCRSKEYDSIHWNYDDSFLRQERNVFLCNGILINNNVKKDERFYNLFKTFGMDISTPNISVIDKECHLGLDIAREKITKFDLEDVFTEELCKYWLAQILTTDCSNMKYAIRHETVTNKNSDMFTILARTFLYHLNEEIYIVGISRNERDELQKIYESKFPYFVHNVSIYSSIKRIDFDGEVLLDNCGLSSSCEEVWVRKTNDIQNLLPNDFENIFRSTGFRPNHLDMNTKNYYLNQYDSNLRCSPIKLTDEVPLVIKYKPIISEDRNMMLKMLRKYIPLDVNDGWIPIDIEKRRSMYPKAFEELKRYIKNSD